MTIEEFKNHKPPNVEEYDPPIIINPNPTQEQIDVASELLEKYYERVKILKSEMEIKYEEYLKSDDKIKIINGKEYYKIVDCDIGNVFGIIIVPHKAVPKPNVWLVDENGFKFFTSGLVHFRFSGDITEWYLKLATIGIDVVKPCKIGEYVRMCEEDEHEQNKI